LQRATPTFSLAQESSPFHLASAADLFAWSDP
jgi:hypothetical protein